MDATAQLALMTKAKIVFERPGTFLSFPALAPIAFPPAVLDFGKALSDPKVSAALLEFSRAVNQCPMGVIFQGDSDQYLWEHYDRWLNAMSLARDKSSPDQDALYTQAKALLTTQDSHGLTTDSPALSNYKQYRDKYLAAEQGYKSAQSTALMSQDPATRAQWQGTGEPRLRDAVAKAMADWEESGNKTAIETAQTEVATYEARMPSKVWMEWRAAYNPDLDLFTDAASNATCGPSGFAPANVFDQPWTNLTLTADEIRGLTANAPKELQNIFEETGTSQISTISFEFCSAAVVRTWFNSAIADARFWKFDQDPELSDGGAPPKGAWPAYVAAVVFIRNIRETTVTAPQSPPVPVRTIPPIVIRPEVLHTLAVMQPAPVVRPQVVARPQVMMMARPAMAAPAAMAVAPPVLVNRPPAPPPRSITVNPALLLGAAVYRVPVPPGPSPTAGQPPQPAPPPAPVAHSDDQISILAFICRPLPKVPNPDPALSW
jgi:hypothetical protein